MTSPRELVERIWSRDATVWTGHDEAHWLGWLDEPARMLEELDVYRRLADETRDSTDAVVVLGMGGSSLAALVLAEAFGAKQAHILDTTHPRTIRHLEQQLDLERTLFVASSKSGTTLETRTQADYFWAKNYDGSRWIAVTDPGTDLARLAAKRNFRAVFSGETSIGGRYSALSPFGMVPAALMGIDLGPLLERAAEAADACRQGEDNPGLELGLTIGEQWQAGRDKLCFEAPGLLGLWIEQLVAESTGKQGRGIVPAPGESPVGDDRQSAEITLADPVDLGREFFRWEFAIAVAGSVLEINPFDQPDVQAAKDRTAEQLEQPTPPAPGESLEALLERASPGDYVAIQAFVEDTDEARGKLAELASVIRGRTGCVVTSGFGPRYLHSTGQLHKGGPPTGLFVQVVEDYGDELSIPHRPFGFAQLIQAQADGDLNELTARGRPVTRLRLDELS